MSNKITLAGAGWCGFTNTAINTIVADENLKDKFEFVNCSPEKGEKDFRGQDDTAHPACQTMQNPPEEYKNKLGFPTFMQCTGEGEDKSCKIVKVGFTENLKEEILDKV